MLIKAFKEHERRDGEKEGFAHTPADALAFKFYRDVRAQRQQQTQSLFCFAIQLTQLVLQIKPSEVQIHIRTKCSIIDSCTLSELISLQAGETRRKHEIHDFIERGLAVAESERAKATLVSPPNPPPAPRPRLSFGHLPFICLHCCIIHMLCLAVHVSNLFGSTLSSASHGLTVQAWTTCTKPFCNMH